MKHQHLAASTFLLLNGADPNMFVNHAHTHIGNFFFTHCCNTQPSQGESLNTALHYSAMNNFPEVALAIVRFVLAFLVVHLLLFCVHGV